MTTTVLFWVLVTLPLVLMVASQVYAVNAQDSRGHYIVILSENVAPDEIAQEHAKQFGVKVLEIWDSSFKGYSASVPVKKVKALREDVRVTRVEMHEAVAPSDRWNTDPS